MPIPSSTQPLVEEALSLLRAFGVTDYKVKVDVRPYLMYDLGYEIHKKEKLIEFNCYSARFPATWENWIEDSCKEVAGKIKAWRKK